MTDADFMAVKANAEEYGWVDLDALVLPLPTGVERDCGQLTPVVEKTGPEYPDDHYSAGKTKNELPSRLIVTADFANERSISGDDDDEEREEDESEQLTAGYE